MPPCNLLSISQHPVLIIDRHPVALLRQALAPLEDAVHVLDAATCDEEAFGRVTHDAVAGLAASPAGAVGCNAARTYHAAATVDLGGNAGRS